MIFDYTALTDLANTHAQSYQSTEPYPYIQFDNFAQTDAANAALDAFPTPDSMAFYKYDNPLEKKLGMDRLSVLPEPIVAILQELNSAQFLNFLEGLTGIDGLIPDPYYRGGGIHQSQRGGKLDIHIDFNIHPKLKLHRRLNGILYLNKDWEDAYGGFFDIWDGHQDANNQHVLTKKMASVAPLFNRFVLFNTSERSYHGFPDPIQCPESMTRKSIAVYYYTALESSVTLPAHSTTFIGRPDDPKNPELDALREQRNRGRLASNL